MDRWEAALPQRNPTSEVLLSMERRVNFTLQDLAPVAPPFDHLMGLLQVPLRGLYRLVVGPKAGIIGKAFRAP